MTNFRVGVTGSYVDDIWSFSTYVSGNATESAAQAAAVTGITNLFTAMEGVLPADVSVTSVYATTLNTQFLQTTKTVTSSTLVGTSTAEGLPLEVSPVLSTTSASATKSGRGRLFLPAPDVTTLADRKWTTGFVTTLTDAGQAWFGALTAASLTPFVFNRQPLKSGTPDFTITNLTGFKVGDQPRSQRRRRSKVPVAYVTSAF